MTLSALTRQEIKAGCMPKIIPQALNAEAEIEIKIGLLIRRRRRMIGMTQRELAQACGVTFQQVQKYESGLSKISAARLAIMARALSCKLIDLYPSELR